MRSAILAKLALPMTRLNIMRPPTVTRVGLALEPLVAALAEGVVQLPGERIAPEVVRERRCRCARSSASFARRSAISLFSSPLGFTARAVFRVAHCHTPAFSDASMN